MKEVRSFDTLVIGAGFAGIGAAIRLEQDGFRDFAILEKADELGGTWRDNTYPGCACDVESHLYCFSFAPNPDWSRSFATSAEILKYLRACADRYRVRERIRFGCEVREARWDGTARRWRLETSLGPFDARVLIAGMGPLSEPRVPELPGLASFAGRMFHTARWDHSCALEGRSVAVIGTGASAVQVIPAIQPLVKRLSVYQRTPAWVVPQGDREIGERERGLLRRIPALGRARRARLYLFRELLALGFLHPRLMKPLEAVILRQLARAVPDPELRRKLTPSYGMGCKRILLSDRYWPTFNRENVELVSEKIREIRPRSIVCEGGREREADVLVLATGFRVTDLPFYDRVHGAGGRTLREAWQDSPKAHLGISVSGFPNLFLLLGPNTGLGHSSVVLMIESQLSHVLGALRYMREHRLPVLEPRASAQARFVERVDARMPGTIWSAGACASWYIDRTGRNSTIWPGFTWTYRLRVRRFNPKEYEMPNLNGKRILITGAARGIGAETARQAAARGARVALVGLEPELLAALSRELPGSAWAECDVTDQASLERAVARVAEALGGLDMVVANAGIASSGTVAVTPIEALARTIDVNLTGVVRTVKATLPRLLESKGHFLIISSSAAFPACPGLATYAASKAGVEHFSHSLRLELQHKGITVGVAHPNWVSTDLVRDWETMASFGKARARAPRFLRRVLSVEECASALVDGLERRSRRIYIPKSLAWLQAFRTLFFSRAWDAYMGPIARESIPEVEREVVAHGRPFGAKSVEARKWEH